MKTKRTVFILTLLLGFAGFLTTGFAQTYVHHTSFTYETGLARALAFSPDGSMLASGGGPVVHLDEPETDRPLRSLEGHTKPVMAVAFSPDGRMLASASGDYTIKLWNPHTGQLIRTLEGHTNQIYAVAFSRTGQLASGGRDHTVRLWNTETGENRILGRHGDWVLGVAFSSTGLLASSGRDNTIRIWDAPTGAPLREITGHTNFVTSVAFTATGDTLVSGSRDNTIRIWNAASGGAALQTLRGHTDWVNSVAVSANGTVASAGADETVRLWNLQTGQRIATFDERTDLVRVVAFSRDGQWLASGSMDGTVQLWQRSGLDETQVVAPAVEMGPIHIPDAELADAIREARWLPAGTIITADMMQNLGDLDLSEHRIADLTGLEHAVNLWRLYLVETDVSDISPLENLTNLRVLSLGETDVSDISPLGNLTNLEWLYLGETDVSDISPLENLTNLERLYLGETDVSDISALANLPNLEALSLLYCPLNNAAYDTHIPALQAKGVTVLLMDDSPIINIPDAGLASAIHEALGLGAGVPITEVAMRRLTRLDASGRKIRYVTGLEYATQLEVLDVSNNDGITFWHKWDGPEDEWWKSEYVDLSTNLKWLDLSNTSFSNMPALANLTNLEYLNLNNNWVKFPKGLENLTQLKELHLGNPYPFINLLFLDDLPQLEVLDLSGPEGASGDDIPRVNGGALGTLTNLKWLDISYVHVTGNFSDLANLTRLETLDISHFYADFLDVSDLENLLVNLPKLKELSFSGRPLSNATLTALQAKGITVFYTPDAELAKAIRRALGLGAGARITVAAMRELTELNVSHRRIADLTGLEYATQLEWLDLSYSDISDISVLANLPQLEYLNLDGLVNEGLEDFSVLANLPQLKRLLTYEPPDENVSARAILTQLEAKGVQVELNVYSYLYYAIREALQLDEGARLTRAAMRELTELITNAGYKDTPLSGLEYAINLQTLKVYGDVGDISVLANLTNLRELMLGNTGNDISDISAMVANLPNLRWLGLSLKNFSDFSALANLPQLRELDLSGTQVSDISALANLTNLETLNLHGSTAVSDISALVNFTNLETLNLSGTQVSDISVLVNLTNLEELNIVGCPLSDASRNTHIPALEAKGLRMLRDLLIPDEIGAKLAEALRERDVSVTISGLERVSSLDVSGSEIANLTGLEYATNLWQLDLSDTNVWGISALANLTRLETLNLSDTNVLDISALANLTNLWKLYLNDTNVSDISALANLTNLDKLDLSGTDVSDISVLANVPLWQLDLSGTDVSDISVLANLTNLEELDLSGCPLSAVSHSLIPGLRKRGVKVTAPPPPVMIDGLSLAEGKSVPNHGGNRFIILTQYGNTCGPTSLEMVLHYYVKITPMGAIWQAGDIDTVEAGTWPGEMRQALNELGVPAHLYNEDTDGYRNDPFERLRRYVDGNRPPCILLRYPNENDEARYHWVVVVGYHYDSGAGIDEYLIADPHGKFRWESRSRLDRVWSFRGGESSGYWQGGFDATSKADWSHLAVDLATNPYTAIVPTSGATSHYPGYWTEMRFQKIKGDKKFRGKMRDWDATFSFNYSFDFCTISEIDLSHWGARAFREGSRIVDDDKTVEVWGRIEDGKWKRGELDVMVRTFRHNFKGKRTPHVGGGFLEVKVIGAPSRVISTCLLPNYPNPFNPETWIPYELSEAAEVSVTIHASDGRLVRRLALGQMPSGVYRSRSRAAYWDGRNAVGEPVASGVYFYTLKAGDFKATRKLVIRK